MSPNNLLFIVDSGVMFFMFLYFFTNAFYYRPDKRLFHYLLSQISIVSSVSYYLLFLEIGNITNNKGQVIRLPRHVDWIINTPLQLITLGNIGQLSTVNTYTLCFLDVLMIISGLLGELTENLVRWSFFGLGCMCFFPLYIFLFEDFDHGTVSAFAGEYVARAYYKIGRFLLSVWLFYPLVWLLRNSDHMGNLYEDICYSVLDLFSKICFPLWVLVLIKSQYLKDNDTSQDEESPSTIITT